MSSLTIKANFQINYTIQLIFLLFVFLNFSAVFASEPIKLALSKTPLSLPVYIASHEGFFNDEGIQVDVEEVIGGKRSMQMLLDGKADLSTSSEAVVMFTSYKSEDIAVVGSFVTTMHDVKVVTRDGLTEVSQLTEKRIATLPGSASHYYLDTLALLNGVDPQSFKLTNMQPEKMPEALARNEVDAVAIWQPYAYWSERKVKDSHVLDDKGFYTLSFTLISSRKLINENSKSLEKILKAIEKSVHFIKTQPKRAKLYLKDWLKLENDYIEWMWGRYNYRLELTQSLITTLESESRWAKLGGYVAPESSPNYLEFIHTEPLRNVNSSLVNIIE